MTRPTYLCARPPFLFCCRRPLWTSTSATTAARSSRRRPRPTSPTATRRTAATPCSARPPLGSISTAEHSTAQRMVEQRARAALRTASLPPLAWDCAALCSRECWHRPNSQPRLPRRSMATYMRLHPELNYSAKVKGLLYPIECAPAPAPLPAPAPGPATGPAWAPAARFNAPAAPLAPALTAPLRDCAPQSQAVGRQGGE